MHITTWITLATAGLVAAGQHARRDTFTQANAPAVKTALTALTPAIKELDAAIAALTAGNAATQIDVIVAKGKHLGEVTSAQSAKMAASPPFKGITDALSLLTPGMATIKALNQTFQDISAKVDIIKGSGQVDKIGDLLKSEKPVFSALNKAITSQIPPSSKGSAPKLPAGVTLPPMPSEAEMDKMLDNAIDQVIAILKGTQASFTIPPEILAQLPKMTGVPSAAGGAPGGAPAGAGGLGGLGGASGGMPGGAGGLGGLGGAGGAKGGLGGAKGGLGGAKGGLGAAKGSPKGKGGIPKSNGLWADDEA
ncbi:hypothetical protein EJ06DRAFT_324926 [Trichodelitschia bisporula]|uniref:Cell wall protein n=1 Tax=Trichodelitschia bisporula TaxID=703511 RepID=A0A6G1I510_9PEZI|nr:hypothetical protein EJ06DRAFT_324926 [Trichodelitschia bisporula]